MPLREEVIKKLSELVRSYRTNRYLELRKNFNVPHGKGWMIYLAQAQPPKDYAPSLEAHLDFIKKLKSMDLGELNVPSW